MPQYYTDKLVAYSAIEHAASRLAGIVNKTPILSSRTLNNEVNASAYLKCENFQRIGAFKFRGAYNAMSLLAPSRNQSGVIAYSSGNHAQAVALAGRLLNVPTTIVMPEDAPKVKLAATRGYGAEIVLYDKEKITREELATQIAKDQGLTIIPPYDHPDVIAGQGTVGKEILEQTEALDILLVCCGGGGLLSGSAIATKHLSPSTKVIGVEPANADDATRTFHSGILQSVHNPDTIADGARTPSLGKYTFPIVMEYVDDMITVSEEEILTAMHFVWERMKLVIEPTGALAVAGLIAHAERFEGMRVGVILSGGNVDLTSLGQFF